MAYRAAVLTRKAQKWVTEVRILHPPLANSMFKLVENQESDLVAFARHPSVAEMKEYLPPMGHR